MIHQKLAETLMNDLYCQGERLPSERSLSDRYLCARSTVKKACALLESQGRLVRLPGCRPRWADQAQTHPITLLASENKQFYQDLSDFQDSVQALTEQNSGFLFEELSEYFQRFEGVSKTRNQ